jgi:hypothetical protein
MGTNKYFAIEQAIKLISTMPDIKNKTKAVFDFADDILFWIENKGEKTT